MNASAEDPGARGSASEGGTESERERGTRRGVGIAGDLMMLCPVGLLGLLF